MVVELPIVTPFTKVLEADVHTFPLARFICAKTVPEVGEMVSVESLAVTELTPEVIVWQPKTPEAHVSAEDAELQVERPKPLSKVPNRFVVEAFVEKKFVVVAEVPVARVKRRFVKLARVEKRLVVVALVPVALPKLKLAKKGVPVAETLRALLPVKNQFVGKVVVPVPP